MQLRLRLKATSCYIKRFLIDVSDEILWIHFEHIWEEKTGENSDLLSETEKVLKATGSLSLSSTHQAILS
jgi:hypothetical protein